MRHDDLTAVVLACEGAEHLGAQLRSILAQTLLPSALLVHDDASTDDTVAVAESFRGDCVAAGVGLVVLRAPSRGGVVRSFERAVTAVSTAYLALADQDDVWLPDKLERQVALLTGGVDVVGSDSELVGPDLAPTGRTLFEVYDVPRDRLAGREPLLAEVLRGNFLSGMTLVVRTGAAQAACPVPSGWIHDYWLVVRAASTGRLAVLDAPTVRYRQHAANQLGARGARPAHVVVRELLTGRFDADRQRRVQHWDPGTVPALVPDPALRDLVARKSAFEHARDRAVARGAVRRAAWVATHLAGYRRFRRAGRRDALRDTLAGGTGRPLDAA